MSVEPSKDCTGSAGERPDEASTTMDRLFVVTGGPGSGKSTLIAALAALGYLTVPESGRAIIKTEVASGGNALPWADRAAFAAAMLLRDFEAHVEASRACRPVLFDRGVADVLGYLRLCRLPVPDATREAVRCYRYNRRVLVAPPWRAIYAQDEERKQTFAEAEATYETMLEIYAEVGYEPVTLPLVSVAERVAFVRALIITAH